MGDVDFERLDELFHQALELDGEERRAFVAKHTEGLPELRRELEGMLESTDPQETEVQSTEQWFGGLLASSLDTEPGAADDVGAILDTLTGRFDDAQPSTVGAYRILDELGRGGLGTVYRAERDDAEYNRQVALKLVRRGLESPEVEERFRLERQILAKLDHPHIARLYDGGTTREGRPYFVMELIEGGRLDHWCKETEAPLVERLELMRKVCDAVHYAHRNLVLHRDLKPSNILVDGDGQPKLLDFGIAKVLDQDPGDDTEPVAQSPELTVTGNLLLTPEFASPEQVRAEVLTTASDVYSLGVLLYILITGQPPYQLDRRRASDIERVVCGVEPERPSAVARRSPEGAAPGWNPRSGGDDLDNIVGMALRKEPERRYVSAAELSEDLRRYLQDLPVKARPDSFQYRMGKFVRRNRIPVAAAALVALTLAAAVLMILWQARIAIHEREKAEKVTEVLVETFDVSDPYQALGETVTAREILDRSSQRIQRELTDNPELRATLLGTMGRVYKNLSLYDSAADLLDEALLSARQSLGEHHPEVIRWRVEIGELELLRGHLDAVESLIRETAGSLERAPLQDRVRLMILAAELASSTGRFEEAEQRFAEAQELLNAARHPLLLAEVLDGVAEMWVELQEHAKAKGPYERALELRRQELGDEHPKVAESWNDLGLAIAGLGDQGTAETYFRRALEVHRRVFGDQHAFTGVILYNLARSRLHQGDSREAEVLLKEASNLRVDLFGPKHPAVAEIYRGLARVYQTRGREDPEHKTRWRKRALELARQAMEIDLDHFGPDSRIHIDNLFVIASLERATGAHDVALEAYRQAQSLMLENSPGDIRRGEVWAEIGACLLRMGRSEEAEAAFRSSLSTLEELRVDPGDWRVALARGELALSLADRGQTAEARSHLEPALATFENIFPTASLTRRLRELKAEIGKSGAP